MYFHIRGDWGRANGLRYSSGVVYYRVVLCGVSEADYRSGHLLTIQDPAADGWFPRGVRDCGSGISCLNMLA